MPDITEPIVIRFLNEQGRPMAELLRELGPRVKGFLTTYNVQIAPLLTGNAGTDPILDGREAEGVSALLLSDLQNLVTQVAAIDTQFSGVGVADVIDKPTVRAPGATVSI